MVDSFYFFGKRPSHQNALDLFQGEWSTRLPDDSGLVASTGPVRACEDYRVDWYEPYVGGFAGKRVLELGPLEGGHTYMLDRRGASEVLSIEANSRAFVKCLIMKEVFNLKSVRFMLGDCIPFLEQSQDRWEIVFASGILYHQKKPVEFLRLVTSHCRHLFLWTHFYDESFFADKPEMRRQFAPAPEEGSSDGLSYKLHRRSYLEAVQWKGFCGGSESDAFWLSKEDILRVLEHFGMEIKGLKEERNNPNGPSLLVAAEKKT